ncbi:uncharacterized protein LOC110249295 [Rhizophagus irregularis DAOM 181602=DAOM 197198]|nr:uncharacterized protein LOC110249295 [Rhizophagus irregularis DAOM 181602=DAOM 197198]
MQKVEDYVNYGSGWEFYRVEKIFIEISQFQPPTGAGHIPLPKDLATKKGVVNPANDDDKCFQWAILAALHPVEKNAERFPSIRKNQEKYKSKSPAHTRILRNPMEMMPLTTQEQASYDNAINCWICRNPLDGNKELVQWNVRMILILSLITWKSIWHSIKYHLNYSRFILRKVSTRMNIWMTGKSSRKTSLPPKGAFYSKLNETHISDKEYEYAQYVWEKAGCKTMQNYHDIYLKTDVLLLADIFQNFREMALKKYGLDPLWYYSTPGFAWDALFLMTGQRLDLITDQDMYMMVEQGLRGGISMVSKRYARANNPGMGEGKWTTDKPKSSILYLDANNLYGWAMLQYLPTGNFHWIKEENELSNIQRQIESNEIPDDSSEGYILKVKLEYPQAFHSQHTDYPLAPERMKVKKEWLSKKQQEIIARSGQRYTPTDKLIPNLFDKDEYVVHYRNLQYYVSQGLVIKKVYEAIKFEQAPWMKPYIEFNTAERAKAKNDFEKDFYKLMNNSVFGKTMENLRKRVRVSVVQPQTHPKKYKKLTSDPAFKGRKIFSENLVAIH